MFETISNLNPILLALIATLCTWGGGALGAALVFATQKVNRAGLDALLGLAGGVMLAASYWSLLAPSIALAEAQGMISWLPALIGFAIGGLFLRGLDSVLPHVHREKATENAEGLPTEWRRSILLISVMTLHNIPEGLAIGVAFGALASGGEALSLSAAFALMLGIALHNIPEGLAVAMPLKREGMSSTKAFFYGQASGMVEPIAGVIGAAAVLLVQPILPYALAFAAGAMIYVVVEEVIPESQAAGHTDLATLGLMFGFGLMMVLAVGLS